MNVLIGCPTWSDWCVSLKQLPNVYFDKLDNIANVLVCIKKYNTQIIIPITYKQMQFVSDNYTKLKELVLHVTCSKNYDVVDCLNNKLKFHEFMLKSGFSNFVPQRYVDLSIDAQIKLPCIAKKNISAGGQGSYLCLNMNDAKNAITKPDYIVQECIASDTEHCGNFYVDENSIIIKSIYYYTKRKTKIYIQMGKMQNKIKNTDIVLCANLDDVFGQLFKELNYTGFACADFKIVDGVVKIFEINPRLGGSLVYDLDDLTEMFNSIG